MRSFTLHILLYPEGSHYVAHCLEFDLVAQGQTKGEAFRNLLDAIELQIEFAIEENNVKSLYRPAPIEYWQLLAHSRPYPYRLKRTLPKWICHLDCATVAEPAYG